MDRNEMPFGEALGKLGTLDPKEVDILLNDSPEWNLIANAYADTIMMENFVLPVVFETMIVGVLQATYYLGYKRGKAEKAMPIFMVGKELTE